MSVITLPTNMPIAAMSWRQKRNDVEARSIFGAQAIEVAPPLWMVSIEPKVMKDSDSNVWKATLLKLRGRVNQFECWDVMRPAPLGTMRGTMTLNANAAQGATSMQIVASGENSKTLKQGDLLGIGAATTQQVLILTEDSTSNGSGIISVTFEAPLRNAFLIGQSVIWDKPKALFRRTESEMGWDYSTLFVNGMRLELLEDWRL